MIAYQDANKCVNLYSAKSVQTLYTVYTSWHWLYIDIAKDKTTKAVKF